MVVRPLAQPLKDPAVNSSTAIKDALAIASGKVGKPVEDASGKLFEDVARVIAKAQERAVVGERLGLPSRQAERSYFIDLAKKSAGAVKLPSSKRGEVTFSGAGDASSQTAAAAAEGLKEGIGEAVEGLRELGIDLPDELSKVVEVGTQLAACAAAIGLGASQGAAIGAATTSGACATGIGCVVTAAGAEIGTIVGVLSAAWQCGLFDLAIEGVVFVVEKIGELVTEIFDPKPENFLYYFDVGGPALRPNGWTPSSRYDEMMIDSMLRGMPDSAREQVKKSLLVRISGSKVNGLLGLWLIRRTKELGGGAEEWARVSKILGVNRGPQKRDPQNYDALSKALENADSSVRNLMKPALVGALVAGGFNSVEAQEKVYGTKAKGLAQARIELGVLRAMLTQLEPGKREMDEQEKLKSGARYFDASARKKFGGKGGVPPFVGVLAVLGASYVLSSPVPAILGAGAYFLTRKKKQAEPEKMTKEEAVAEIRASGKDPFKGAFK